MSVALANPRLDFDEYIVALCDAMLDFVDEPADREELRRIAQRVICERGGV